MKKKKKISNTISKKYLSHELKSSLQCLSKAIVEDVHSSRGVIQFNCLYLSLTSQGLLVTVNFVSFSKMKLIVRLNYSQQGSKTNVLMFPVLSCEDNIGFSSTHVYNLKFKDLYDTIAMLNIVSLVNVIIF